MEKSRGIRSMEKKYYKINTPTEKGDVFYIDGHKGYKIKFAVDVKGNIKRKDKEYLDWVVHLLNDDVTTVTPIDIEAVNLYLETYPNSLLSSLETAKSFAEEKHKDQKDLGGNDYFTSHICDVADKLTYADEKILGYLHDILEDTDVSEDTIEEMFGSKVLNQLSVLNRNNYNDYDDYIDGIAHSAPEVIATKVADLESNLDLSRLKKITKSDIKRQSKYLKALNILVG